MRERLKRVFLAAEKEHVLVVDEIETEKKGTKKANSWRQLSFDRCKGRSRCLCIAPNEKSREKTTPYPPLRRVEIEENNRRDAIARLIVW